MPRTIGGNPSYQRRKGDYRHVTLHKLPYRVVFEVEDGTGYVYQVRTSAAAPARNSGHRPRYLYARSLLAFNLRMVSLSGPCGPNCEQGDAPGPAPDN